MIVKMDQPLKKLATRAKETLGNNSKQRLLLNPIENSNSEVVTKNLNNIFLENNSKWTTTFPLALILMIELCLKYAEADCFFCFTNLMSEIRDFFIKSLDESDRGINKMMNKLLIQLRNCDLQIWLRFQQLELKPQYYSFRWITLLLSQEFALPDVLRIWDSLFSDNKRFDFLIHVCCAMIIILRNQILEGDFPSNLKLLQNFPPMDVQIILSKAAELSRVENILNPTRHHHMT